MVAATAAADSMSVGAHAGFGTTRQYGVNYEALVANANVTAEAVAAIYAGVDFRYDILPWLGAQIEVSASQAGGGTYLSVVEIGDRDTHTVLHVPLLAVFSWVPSDGDFSIVGLFGPSALLRIMSSYVNDLTIGGSTTTTQIDYTTDESRSAIGLMFGAGVEYRAPFGTVSGSVRTYRTLTSMDPDIVAAADKIFYGGFLFEIGYRFAL